MLNLLIAMLKFPLIISLVFLMQSTSVSITSPLTGDTLRGQVQIAGVMDVPNFASAELAFSYAPLTKDAANPAAAWFTIQTFPQPVQDSVLAIWDTTTLTDGDYNLNLHVVFQDGTSQDVLVSDLKIRNDAPLATEVPTATNSVSGSIDPLYTPTIQPATALPSYPSATPMPINPASVTSSSIYSNFARGAFLAFLIFITFSILLRFRKN